MMSLAVFAFVLKVAVIAIACRYFHIFDRQSAVIFAGGAVGAYVLSGGVDATMLIVAFTMGAYVLHLLFVGLGEGRIGAGYLGLVFSRANFLRHVRLFLSMAVALLFVGEVFRRIDFSGIGDTSIHYAVSFGILGLLYAVPESVRYTGTGRRLFGFRQALILAGLYIFATGYAYGELAGIFFRSGVFVALIMLYEAIYDSFTREVAAGDVAAGMTLAEVVVRKEKSYYVQTFPFVKPTSIIRSRLRHKAAGEEVVFWPFRRLCGKDVEVLRNIMSTYGIDKIRVQNTADFRPYVVAGVLAAAWVV